MQLVGGRSNLVRRAAAASVAISALAAGSCSSSSPTATSVTTGPPITTGTTAATTSTAAGASTAAVTPATTTTTNGFEAASDGPRSAPQVGSGTAQLTAVRVARHLGFERVVFEFAGTSRPGYRISWTSAPITADGSGAPVSVDGPQRLLVIMEPASGFDAQTGSPTYRGSDHIAVAGRTALITDLVRTGDFESVLTWVVGAGRRVPYRVASYRAPTRLVIDLQAR